MFEPAAARVRFIGLLVTLLVVSASRPADAGCTTDDECKGERICEAGVCTAPPAAQACAKDTDCAGDQVCEQATCVVTTTPITVQSDPPPRPAPETPSSPPRPDVPAASFTAATPAPKSAADAETPSEPQGDKSPETPTGRRNYEDGGLGIIPLEGTAFLGVTMTASQDLGTPSKHGGLVLGIESTMLAQTADSSIRLLGLAGFLGYRLQAAKQVAFIGRAGLQVNVLDTDAGTDLAGNLVLGGDLNLGWFLVGLESWVGETRNFMFRIGFNFKQAKK